MDAFEKFFNDTFEVVEVIKYDEKNFIARVYDKNSKKLCVMKKRNLKSKNLYKILREINDEHIPEIYRIFEREENLIFRLQINARFRLRMLTKTEKSPFIA